ncbi:peptide ABC transporter substrate-binding protein [Hazenella sp. IB182357]|uniref:Peptide ABC transporter substrate-binding protein n=1 Tax=Polycladospora coralii TaxID=2771432 RepID=A0A926RU68_9BACL|nr:peptide ABC transporter substrate-binding protein [Polycladospora coralii]MBD1372197.1 peptide ABC transporter substrate-binding protein [Polycladospora coralii]
MHWKKSIAFIFLLFFLAGCNVMSGDTEEKRLRLVESTNVVTLDSVLATDTSSINVLNNVGEGLMRLGADHQPTYGLAEKVEVSDDGLEYTFYLRENAKWSDGESVHASDFEYAWEKAINPQTNAKNARIFFDIKNAQAYHKGEVKVEEVGIKVENDQVLKVTLEQPAPHFQSMLTLPIFQPQRKEIVEKYGDEYGSNSIEVYSGPFMIMSMDAQKMILKKNEYYWDFDTVNIDQVEILTIKNTEKGIQAYQSGEVDATKLDQEFIDAFKGSPGYLRVDMARVQYVLLNQKNEFLANKHIKRAVTLALNRDQIVNEILKDGSEPAGSIVPPSISGVDNQTYREMAGGKELITFNIKEAQKEFKLGLEELQLTEAPEDIQLLGYDDSRRYVSIEIKKQLRDVLGFTVLLNSPISGEKHKLTDRHEFDMTVTRWRGDYDDAMNYLQAWTKSNRLNHISFANTEYDSLLQKAKQATSKKERIKHLIAAEKLLISSPEGQAIVPLYYINESYLQNPDVVNFYRHPFGPDYSLKWVDKKVKS